MDEPSSQQPQQKSSWVEVAKRRIAQQKVWIPLAIAVAFLRAWSLFNLRESTLLPLSLKARNWTGFGADSTTNTERDSANKVIKTVEVEESSKTLWDWLSVLGVPLTLALLGFWVQALQQKQAEEGAKVEKEIAETARKEEAIQAYFDRLSDLLVDKNLIAIASKVQSFEARAKAEKEKSGDNPRSEELELPAKLQEPKEQLDAAIDVIRARTLAILRRLKDDAERKTSVVQFLIEAEVVEKLRLSLRDADLSGISIGGRFTGEINPTGANLTGIDLNNANLKGADFSSANLTGANLCWADLSSADLCSAELNQVNLESANLCGANLIDVEFVEAFLSGANLVAADLSSARIIDSIFCAADLTEADFSDALILESNFSGANLTNANLSRAIFFSTDLRNTKGLTQEQLEGENPPLLCNVALPQDQWFGQD